MSVRPGSGATPVTRYVYYIHGFASSPRSTKAEFLSDRLNRAGVGFSCPDFNQPDFSTLTVSRMIEQIETDLAGLEPGPVALIGSSLGGLVAFHAAARQCMAADGTLRRVRPAARIDRLVLLAPALDFCRGTVSGIDDAAFERWRTTGSLDVYHHGDQVMRPVGFGLYQDARQYDSFSARVPVPTLIFQGLGDELVNPAMVQRFAASRPHVSLRLLADDHRLTASLETIWQETRNFLGLV